jgi:heme oxygenase
MSATTTPSVAEKSPLAAVRADGTHTLLQPASVPAEDALQARSRLILAAMVAFRDGDFTVRLPRDWAGNDRLMAEAFNQAISHQERIAHEVARLSVPLGPDGQLAPRMTLPGAAGGWAAEVDSLNTLLADRVQPTTEVASAVRAAAKDETPKLSILKRLRQETSERHAGLEQRMTVMDPHLSRTDYRALIEGFFGYYAPLEARLGASPIWAELAFDFAARRKVPRLEKDLMALGKTAEELTRSPRCAELPQLDTMPQVLGCLYVIEGATLGGQVITRHLLATHEITPETGGAFFAGYGAETGPRWQAFGAMITAAAERSGAADEIIASANRTFETLDHWLFPRPVR